MTILLERLITAEPCEQILLKLNDGYIVTDIVDAWLADESEVAANSRVIVGHTEKALTVRANGFVGLLHIAVLRASGQQIVIKLKVKKND